MEDRVVRILDNTFPLIIISPVTLEKMGRYERVGHLIGHSCPLHLLARGFDILDFRVQSYPRRKPAQGLHQ